MRLVYCTSEAVYDPGGIKRSALLRTVPNGVDTLTRPEGVVGGTVVDSDVLVVPDRAYAGVRLTFTRSLAKVVVKFVPVMVSDAPTTAVVGVKLVIVGALLDPTTNEEALVPDPDGDVTPMVP